MAEARYIYGSAAPKRSYDYAAPRRRDRVSENGFEVVRGGNRREVSSQAYDFAIRAAKIALIAVLAFALIGFGRVTLSTAAVSEAVQAKELESELSEMRSEISTMQAERSSLSNPVKIKKEAVSLGMVSPEETKVIELEQDVVSFEGDGTLSLTGSLENLA